MVNSVSVDYYKLMFNLNKLLVQFPRKLINTLFKHKKAVSMPTLKLANQITIYRPSGKHVEIIN